MSRRSFVFDISSLARWTGAPSGMIRCEHELASFVLRHVPAAVFAVYDGEAGGLLRLRPEIVPALISYTGRLLGREPPPVERRRARLVPSRRHMFLDLERARVTARSRLAKALYGVVQSAVVVGRRLPFETRATDGTRLDLVRFEDAIAGQVAVRPGDVLFFASSDWWHKTDEDIAHIADLGRSGVRVTAICYDILPLIRPQWFGEPAGSGEDIRRFRRYWHGLLPAARTVIVNSNRVRDDLIAYCAQNAIRLQTQPRVVPLGSDKPRLPGAAPRLDSRLRAGRFALYVSTIEPRKNHALLLRIWSRLLQEGVPQRAGFKLVFVGRKGWNVDEVLASLDHGSSLYAGTVIHFEQLADSGLEQLYAGCAFCLYPSEYEGFGIPIVEGYAHGKAVIASHGGSLAEVVGKFSPCLDPADEQAWTATLRQWIEHPEARAAYEDSLRRESPVLGWAEVATRMIAAAADDSPPPSGDAVAAVPPAVH